MSFSCTALRGGGGCGCCGADEEDEEDEDAAVFNGVELLLMSFSPAGRQQRKGQNLLRSASNVPPASCCVREACC